MVVIELEVYLGGFNNFYCELKQEKIFQDLVPKKNFQVEGDFQENKVVLGKVVLRKEEVNKLQNEDDEDKEGNN